MNVALRVLLMAALGTLAFSTCGCSKVWHNLQPHRLQQLNRGPGMPTGPEAYSSISDFRALT